MNSLIAAAKVFARDEDGITAIEYGLIAATMVTVVVAGLAGFSTDLKSVFTGIGTKLVAAGT